VFQNHLATRKVASVCVPELTRGADIKLNARLSLPRPVKALSSRHEAEAIETPKTQTLRS